MPWSIACSRYSFIRSANLIIFSTTTRLVGFIRVCISSLSVYLSKRNRNNPVYFNISRRRLSFSLSSSVPSKSTKLKPFLVNIWPGREPITASLPLYGITATLLLLYGSTCLANIEVGSSKLLRSGGPLASFPLKIALSFYWRNRVSRSRIKPRLATSILAWDMFRSCFSCFFASSTLSLFYFSILFYLAAWYYSTARSAIGLDGSLTLLQSISFFFWVNVRFVCPSEFISLTIATIPLDSESSLKIAGTNDLSETVLTPHLSSRCFKPWLVDLKAFL